MKKPKPSRANAAAALVVACLLLPAGFVSHGHDDGNLDGHDHDCVICSLRDHSVLVVPVAPRARGAGAAGARRRIEPRRARFRHVARLRPHPRSSRVAPPSPRRHGRPRGASVCRPSWIVGIGGASAGGSGARPLRRCGMRVRAGSRVVLPIALAWLVAVGPFGSGPAFGLGQAGSIQGIVAAEDGGVPLPAALVVLEGTGMEATTGADGTFVIDGVPAGAYELTVTREAFAPLTSPVTVAGGATGAAQHRAPRAGVRGDRRGDRHPDRARALRGRGQRHHPRGGGNPGIPGPQPAGSPAPDAGHRLRGAVGNGRPVQLDARRAGRPGHQAGAVPGGRAARQTTSARARWPS